MKDAETLFIELLSNQVKNIPCNQRLQYDDLKRITKYIDSSIFDENLCCLWTGYITNAKSNNKGTYINFYFRKKKVALHRLLYINYIGSLSKDEYLKFSCDNKGKCCNIHHMNKFRYQKVTEDTPVKEKKTRVVKTQNVHIVRKDDKDNTDKLIIVFDD